MAGSYIGVATGNETVRATFRAELHRLQTLHPALRIIFETDDLVLATDGLAQRRLPDRKGIVLGRLHIGDPGTSSAQQDEALDRAIYYSRGQALIERCWGGYLAILTAPDGLTEIIKAPLGDLPCYVLQEGDATWLSSHPRLIATAANRTVAVDWMALARQLAFGTIRLRETCLAGILDLAGGERVTIASHRLRWDTLWSPWYWTAPDLALHEAAEIHARIKAVTDAVIDTAFKDRRCLLKLSGGLDSSIVAASLAASGASFTGLTLVTDDASGDERPYATIVADHLSFPLHAERRDPAAIDVMTSPACDLPRPSIPGFRQSSDRLTRETAVALGSGVVIDGGGGDNVFCSLQSAAPVADCMLARSGRSHTLATARSLASIAGVSTLEVLRQAARRSFAKQRNHRWPVDRQFFTERAIAALPDAPAHAWLSAPPGALPGRAAHVALVIGGQSYVEGFVPDMAPPLLAPLLAQPLVELCLRVPSWLWFADGLNRAAARRAFSSALPEAIISRRSKGSPNAFVAQIAETFRPAIRDLLVGGLLVRQGIIDADAIDHVLAGEQPIDDRYLHRIMNLFDAEVWVRSWS